MLFDRYLLVDWSASNKPKTGADSIWICDLGRDGKAVTTNPSTRGKAEQIVRQILREATSRRERTLVGFDFPYGYPRGFASALGLGRPAWRSVWEHLSCLVVDDPRTNANNRFEVACQLNAAMARKAFWGHPPGRAFDSLLATKKGRVAGPGLGLAELRETEHRAAGPTGAPKSVWQLFGKGSVGSQALTGIPVVARLRADPLLSELSRVWPFEVSVPELRAGRAAVVHAEVWPSLVRVEAAVGRVKDEAQVLGLAAAFSRTDQSGDLGGVFARASAGAIEEGWILGV